MIDLDNPDFRPELLGLNEGVVVDNKDPDGLMRVRVRIPGLIEPASAWAYPIGVPGGGSKDRGLFWPPDVGAEVAVFFKGGDPDQPRYMPAMWGAPGGEKETPDASDGGDPDVRVLSFGAYEMVIDTRDGSKKFRIVDKDNGENLLEYDGTDQTMTISATTAINLVTSGQVSIEGLLVSVNGVPAGLGRL